MRIYLGDMEFPVAPERLEILMEGNWERTELEAVGEVIRYRPPGLRLIRFGGIFPERAYGFVTAGTLQSPRSYADQLDRAAAAKEPARLVVSGGARPFSMLAVVARFDWRMQAGEDGDIYYELELREYRDFGKAAVVVSSGAAASVAGTGTAMEKNPAAPAVYTVQRGDTLWAIAKRFLGDGSRYAEIAASNGIRNPNLIYPGQTLRIS